MNSLRNLINIINEADAWAINHDMRARDRLPAPPDSTVSAASTSKRKGQLLYNILKNFGSAIKRHPKLAVFSALAGGIGWFLTGGDDAAEPATAPNPDRSSAATPETPSATPPAATPAAPTAQSDQGSYPATAQPQAQTPAPVPCTATPEMKRIADEATLLLAQAAQFKDARVRNEMEKLDMFLSAVPCLNWSAASWLRQ